MLIECSAEEFMRYMADDPIRPKLFTDNTTRFHGKFRVYADVNKQGFDTTVDAIVCVVVCPFLPQSEEQLRAYAMGDMDKLLQELDKVFGEDDTYVGQLLCLYSLWSYTKGAGRRLVNELLEAVPLLYPSISSVVTMSPPTKMAMEFHTNNGAVLISPNVDTVNYEYVLPDDEVVIH